MGKNAEPNRGFTLIELLITVAVVAILLAIATPSFRTIIKNGRLATESNDLMADLAYSRSEASRRGKRVTLCISSGGTACDTGSAWATGRIVFIDEGTYGSFETGDEILRVNQSQTSNNIVITAAGFSVASTNTLNYVQFKPNGAISSSTPGSFKICDDRTGSFGRKLEILATGRTSLTSTTESCP